METTLVLRKVLLVQMFQAHRVGWRPAKDDGELFLLQHGSKPTAWDKELTFVWQFDSNVNLKDGKRIHSLPSDSDCSLFVFWLSTFGFSILSKSHL